MKATFFEISNTNIFFNAFDIDIGSLFLKNKNVKPNIIKFEKINPTDHIPGSYGFGVTDSVSGIITVFETRISAGKITDTKLINTIVIENKKTAQEINCELEEDSVWLLFNVFLIFLNIKSF